MNEKFGPTPRKTEIENVGEQTAEENIRTKGRRNVKNITVYILCLMNKSRSLVAWTVKHLYKDFSVKDSLWDIIFQWIFIFLTCLKFKNF